MRASHLSKVFWNRGYDRYLKLAVWLTMFAIVGEGVSAQTVVSPDFVPGEVIVKLRGKSKSLKSQAFIGKAVSEKAMTLKGSWGGLNMHHFAAKGGARVEDLLAELRKDPEVEYAEPNYIVQQMSVGGEGQPLPLEKFQFVASDAGVSSVFASGDVSASGNTASSVSTSTQTSAPIQREEAWSALTNGLTPSVVAVIDTGLDLTHTVFVNSGAIWTNPNEIPGNGVDDDHNGFVDDVNGWNFLAGTNAPDDDDGHGTHVSGIILGATQNIFANPIAPAKIRIMPLKFLDASGSGTTSDAIQAIYYAVNNGARVINNSWGGGGYSQALIEALTYAYNHKTILVAAAGNASSNNDSVPIYPANYTVPSQMSIAATSDADAWALFSNFGANTVHISSPGVSILSTYPGNMTYRMSGTSMAAPFVSGVAALMVRESPTMNGYQVRSLLFGGANAISANVNKVSTQSRLNVYNAVMAAKQASVDSSQPGFDASSFRAPSSSSSVQMGGCGLVAKYISGDDNDLSGPNKYLAFFVLMVALSSPILLSLALRHRSGKNSRRYERFQIDSEVRVRFGERELVGKVSTISLGGVQLNTNAWLEKGGVVRMNIQSPDGKDVIEVEGRVVWSEEQKRYGVAFANADVGVMHSIERWTHSLVKI